MTRWRRSLLLGTLIVVFVAGWIAAQTFQSPEQRASEARPPEPRPIVESAASGALVDEVTTRAVVVSGYVDTIMAGALPENAVVTAVPARPGALVQAGSVLVAVNGRPVFVLPGAFRFYRDLVPDMTGPDVEQLQDGLAAMGHAIPEWERGRYGSRTQRAVAALYENADYDPPLLTVGPMDEPSADEASGDGASQPPLPPAPEPVEYLPLTEVAVAPRLPAAVAEARSVGDAPASEGNAGETPDDAGASSGLATLHSGALQVSATVPSSVVVRVEQGMSATVTHGATEIAGTVSTVREAAAAEGSEGQHELVITPDKPLPPEWAGMDVIVRIVVSVVSEPGLIVPTRAVTTGGADGNTYVDKLEEDGSFTRVLITERGTLAGQSAVAPLESGALAEGDKVRVG